MEISITTTIITTTITTTTTVLATMITIMGSTIPQLTKISHRKVSKAANLSSSSSSVAAVSTTTISISRGTAAPWGRSTARTTARPSTTGTPAISRRSRRSCYRSRLAAASSSSSPSSSHSLTASREERIKTGFTGTAGRQRDDASASRRDPDLMRNIYRARLTRPRKTLYAMPPTTHSTL